MFVRTAVFVRKTEGGVFESLGDSFDEAAPYSQVVCSADLINTAVQGHISHSPGTSGLAGSLSLPDSELDVFYYWLGPCGVIVSASSSGTSLVNATSVLEHIAALLAPKSGTADSPWANRMSNKIKVDDIVKRAAAENPTKKDDTAVAEVPYDPQGSAEGAESFANLEMIDSRLTSLQTITALLAGFSVAIMTAFNRDELDEGRVNEYDTLKLSYSSLLSSVCYLLSLCISYAVHQALTYSHIHPENVKAVWDFEKRYQGETMCAQFFFFIGNLLFGVTFYYTYELKTPDYKKVPWTNHTVWMTVMIVFGLGFLVSLIHVYQEYQRFQREHKTRPSYASGEHK